MFSRFAFFALANGLGLAILSGCATTPKDPIPSDISTGSITRTRYATLDQFIEAFLRAGANVKTYDGENVIDIPIGTTNLLGISNALEKTCLNLKGKEGRPERGDNLRNGWYYVLSSGGPTVDFDPEVNSAIRQASEKSENTWELPKEQTLLHRFLCTTYGSGVHPDYPKDFLLKPYFAGARVCEYKDKKLIRCHLLLMRPPFLMNRIIQTRSEYEPQYAAIRKQMEIDDKRAAELGPQRAKLAADQAAEVAATVRTTGTKICRNVSGVVKTFKNAYIGGQPVYSTKNSVVSITGYTENANGGRIQIRIGGISSSAGNSRLDSFDYNGTNLRDGSVFWDDANFWGPC